VLLISNTSALHVYYAVCANRNITWVMMCVYKYVPIHTSGARAQCYPMFRRAALKTKDFLTYYVIGGVNCAKKKNGENVVVDILPIFNDFDL